MNYIKNIFLILIFICLSLFSSLLLAEEEEIILSSIKDQIQVLVKDLKTLEKAVYQKSDISFNNKTIQSSGLNEDILTKHLKIKRNRESI